MAKFSRRHVLGGGSALLIGTGLDGKAHDADARVAGRGRLTADVCVVGAGYAGLAAALRLKQAGAKVIVLEARNRVGGRSLTAPLEGGGWVDYGGQWVGPTQERFYALIKEMGAETYASPDFGKALQRSVVNPAEFIQLGNEVTDKYPGSDLVEAAFAKIDDLAKAIDPEKPWRMPMPSVSTP